MQGKTIHLVPHTHWDREWYFTTARSRVYLIKHLSDVIHCLEQDSRYSSYLLDAQVSLIDDYLAWKPGDESRLRKLISAGRLIIGPWYTQTDQMIISAESIVRNLYHGIRRSKELGMCMMVGYVPDSFGQAGNMPQIYKAVGIEAVLFRRGADGGSSGQADFIWRGDDDTTILATQMIESYSTAGKLLTRIPLDRDEFWNAECIKRIVDRSLTDDVILPIGFDQSPILPFLPDLVERRCAADPSNRYLISSVENYFDSVRTRRPELSERTGELLMARRSRVHRTIWSSRSDIKALNTRVQNYVANILEPLLVLSYSRGNEYPNRAVEEIWKLLFENAAHDSAGSCVSDAVNDDIVSRYRDAFGLAANLVELHSRLIASHIEHAEELFGVTVFNTHQAARSEVIVADLYLPEQPFALVDADGSELPYTIIHRCDCSDYVRRQFKNMDPSRPVTIPKRVMRARIAFQSGMVPAYGYARIQVRSHRGCEFALQKRAMLENEFYRIDVNPDGTLHITDKKTGRSYPHEAAFIDSGDDGDSFNYSPPIDDLIVRSDSFASETTVTGSEIWQQAKIHVDMLAPKDLGDRSAGRAGCHLPIDLVVELRKGSRVIDLRVDIHNRILSHRVRIEFDAQILTDFNYADEQFGLIKRHNAHEDEMAAFLRASSPSDAAPQEPWQEPPLAIEPTQSFVALADESGGLAVIPQGVREYEIVSDTSSKVLLTLMRSYGTMGKSDLLYRSGRASGEETIDTPAAQLLGDRSFTLGLCLFAGDFESASIGLVAKSYNSPLTTYEYAPFLNGRLIFSEIRVDGCLQSSGRLLELKGDLVVSALKKAEDGPGIIVRMFNCTGKPVEGALLQLPCPIQTAYYTNLLEEAIEPAEHDGSSIRIRRMECNKFATLYIEPHTDRTALGRSAQPA